MITIDLFGGIRVGGEGVVLTGRAAQKKRVAILPPLVTARDRGLTRDKLITLLWPETDAPRARHQLASSLYELRSTLGEAAIVSVADTVQLNPARVCSDVWVFEDALERGEVERAVLQYCGPFLDGFFLSGTAEFDHWTELERARLARRCAEALRTLAEARELCSDWSGAASRWRQLAALEPYSGPIVLRLMRALMEAGDRVGAWQCAHAQEATLRADLDVAPDPDVTALAREIRRPSVGNGLANDRRTRSASSAAAPQQTAAAEVSSTLPMNDYTSSNSAAAGQLTLRALLRSRRTRIAVTLALLVMLLSAVWRQSASRVAAPVQSLAVLPFEERPSDSAHAHFADALTDAVIGELGQLDHVRVISRASVMRYARTRKSFATIARELGVEALVHGTIARDAGQVRITLQLVDAAGHRRNWSATLERALRDIPLLEREISDTIARVLRAKAGMTTNVSFVQSNSVDAVAYDFYLRGRYAWALRSREGLERAIVYFRKAIEREPSYAAAFAGLADAYVLLGYLGYYSNADMFQKGKAAALRAIELGGARADAYTALGMEYTWERRWSDAEDAFQLAIRLNPGYATAHHWYSLELVTLGRFDEARREARIASELDPLSLQINNTYGIVLYYAGDTAAAVRQFAKTVAGEPDSLWIRQNPWLLGNMGRVYAGAGRTEEALRLIERAVALVPGHPRALGDLAVVYAQMGDRQRALAVFARADSANEQYPFWRANLFASMVEPDSAFTWLARVREWSPSIMSALRGPSLVRLHNDARWASLLRQLGLR